MATTLVWDGARRLLHWGRQGTREAPRDLSAPATEIARSLCVASGKGGTGKSLVTAALARSLARQARVLLVDGDLGVGNAHLLQDVVPEHSLVDVVAGRITAREALVACGDGFDLLAGGSGFACMASLAPADLARMAAQIGELEPEYDVLLIDAAAGLSRQTLALAAAAESVLLVTTPDVTAMTDAYAFLKVLLQVGPTRLPELVINRHRGAEEAAEVAQRVSAVARRFLGVELVCVASLPEDEAARRSLKRREPVTVCEGDSALGLALVELAARVRAHFEMTPATHPGWATRLAAECFAR